MLDPSEDTQGASELAKLRSAQEICGDSPPALTALLDFHTRHRLPEEEHRLLQQSLLRQLDDPEHPVETAITRHLLVEPDLDPTIRQAAMAALARRVAQSEQPDPGLLQTLARGYESLGNLEDAAATYEQLHRIAPSGDTDWQLLSLYQRLDRHQPMAELLDRMSQRNEAPRFLAQLRAPALARAGRTADALAQIDSFAQAEQAAKSTAELEDTTPFLTLLMATAWSFRDAGLDGEAERMFRRALQVAPTSRVARDALVYIYGDDSLRPQPGSAVQDSLGRPSSDPFVLYEEGTRLLTSSDYEAAYPLLAQAAPALSDLEAAWFNLAMTAYRLERWPEAADAYGRAAELNPERADSWFWSGMAAVRIDDCVRVTKTLERALELDPSRKIAHYHLARCYANLGDEANSKRHGQAWNDSQ
jgi:tetratricopeptide (TPR) repeat protein